MTARALSDRTARLLAVAVMALLLSTLLTGCGGGGDLPDLPDAPAADDGRQTTIPVDCKDKPQGCG